MSTQYGYVRDEMVKTYIRTLLATQFLGQKADKDEDVTSQTTDAA